MSTLVRTRLAAPLLLLALAAAPPAPADDGLAGYFGFSGLEVVRIGDDAGPLLVADLDGDGLNDLVAVNNRMSRIEIHRQRETPLTEVAAPGRVNEFPEHPRFKRRLVPVRHRVMALRAWDWSGDGRLDLVYAGVPAEIVFLEAEDDGSFTLARRHRVPDLQASRDGLAIADLLGDPRPELVAVVAGGLRLWPLEEDRLGTPQDLAAGGDVAAIIVADLTGDGRDDLAGILPENSAPVRIWTGGEGSDGATLGAQRRFEMPPLVEADAVRLPGRAAAHLVVVERPTRRVAALEIDRGPVADLGEASLLVRGFSDGDSRERDHVVADLDGDGRLDLAATDLRANAIAVYRQEPGRGLGAARVHPSLTGITHLVAGDVDEDPQAELFVLSEKEEVVGRCDVEPDGGVPFPVPIAISAGHAPVALDLVVLESGPRLAVIGKDTRDYVLDLITMEGAIESVPLGKLSRSPDAVVAHDADQDGRLDLLVFTKGKPLTMLRATESGYALLEPEAMGQLGLVKAAARENTGAYDVDGDGRAELLLADNNYIRAVRFDPAPETGVAPGWQVVRQINARDRDARLVSIARLADRIVAADAAQRELLLFGLEESGDWSEAEALAVRGFDFESIHAGAFTGDGAESLLLVGTEGFASVRLGGETTVLRETASWRPESERRVPHEIASGDLNGDGLLDLVVLDAAEQTCGILAFSEAGRLLEATAFQVFESRIFSGGDAREYQPSQAFIADIDGDGAEDLVLLCHDRVLLYPQQTAP